MERAVITHYAYREIHNFTCRSLAYNLCALIREITDIQNGCAEVIMRYEN